MLQKFELDLEFDSPYDISITNEEAKAALELRLKNELFPIKIYVVGVKEK
ncbi:hypothetical protein KAW18_02825 [candidate division WOR-3 bacterium]|nr:hypothetical protein [candidate division WOR-3 bacterium]